MVFDDIPGIYLNCCSALLTQEVKFNLKIGVFHKYIIGARIGRFFPPFTNTKH